MACKAIYMAMSSDLPKMQRIATLSIESGLSYFTVEGYAKEGDWEGEFQKRNKDPLEEEAMSVKVLPTDIAFTTIATELKDFAYLSLTGQKEAVESLMLMVKHYSRKIKTLYYQAGGGIKITPIQETEIDLYADSLNKYLKRLEEYIKPSAIASYLKMAGMETVMAAMPEGVDASAHTPDKLSEALRKLGMRAIFDTPELIEDIESEAVDMMKLELLPEIDARKVKDTENQ